MLMVINMYLVPIKYIPFLSMLWPYQFNLFAYLYQIHVLWQVVYVTLRLPVYIITYANIPSSMLLLHVNNLIH